MPYGDCICEVPGCIGPCVTRAKRTLTCVDCGKLFESLAPPAETREDDPDPQCGTCIEKDLDRYDEGPLDDETVRRIMSKVVLDDRKA